MPAILKDCSSRSSQRKGWPTPDIPTATKPEQLLILSKPCGRSHERGVPLCGQPVLAAVTLAR
jgi:hypothetical protein